MANKKQFILGVGCQRGGTTWLHRQLSKSNEVDLGFTKEYHVFDALYVPLFNHFMEKSYSKAAMLWHAIMTNNLLNQFGCLLRSNDFRRNVDNYFKYFDALSQGRHISTVGDMSPSYSTLPVEAFAFVKDNLEKLGFTVKVIFIMRDPIERCWSASRAFGQKPLNEQYVLRSEEEQLKSLYKIEIYEMRTRYEKTISNVESVFPKDCIHYQFYERLFTRDAQKEIQKFLELDDFSPDFEEEVNASARVSNPIDVSLRAEIFEFYRATYEFCDERFDVRDIWPILNDAELTAGMGRL